MEKYKIVFTVYLGVLSFLVRGLQSRSLKEDESAPDLIKVGNIKDWNTYDCVRFPITDEGTPISNFFQPDDDRLVLYFYKNKRTNELTAYIPNREKQSAFPDLTFDLDDKFESVVPERMVELFDNVYFTKDNQQENSNRASPKSFNPVVFMDGPPDPFTIPNNTYRMTDIVEPTPVEKTITDDILTTTMEPNTDDLQLKVEPPPVVKVILNNIFKTTMKPKIYSKQSKVEPPPVDKIIIDNILKTTMNPNTHNLQLKVEPPPVDKVIIDDIVKTTMNPNTQNLQLKVEPPPIDKVIIDDIVKTTMNPNTQNLQLKVEPPPVDKVIIDDILKTTMNPNTHNLQLKVEPPPVDKVIVDNILNTTSNPNTYNLQLKVEPPPVDKVIVDNILNTTLNPNTYNLQLKVEPPPVEKVIIDNILKTTMKPYILNLKEKVEPTVDKTITDNNILKGTMKKNLNLSLGNKQHSLNGIIEPHQSPIPKNSSSVEYKNKKYLPGWTDMLPWKPHNTINPSWTDMLPWKPHNTINPSWTDIPNSNRPNEVMDVEYLPSKYVNPTFNGWFYDQMNSILRSNKPSMGNTINFHSLRLLLIKALYDNGFHLSKDGDVYDPNGIVLNMSNLKLRHILLGDPLDYEKLISTSKCATQSDIPYLEVVLVTLVYPPRVLAIIPLGLKNVFISPSQGRIPKLCGQQPKCHTRKCFRSGLPEEDESTSASNANIFNKNYDETSAEERSGETVEEYKSIESNNGESRNEYSYTPFNSDLDMKNSPELKADIPHNSEKCGQSDSDSGSLVNEEPRILNADTVDEENEKIYVPEEKSEDATKDKEASYSNDDTYDNSPAFLSPTRRANNKNTLLLTLTPSDRGVYGENVIFLDETNNIEERKPSEDLDVPQESSKKPDEDYEMLTIRIVGGNPATSSGTPVSSRGRSGSDA